MNLIPQIKASHAEMKRWRHDMHKHPEPPLFEQRTASKVAELLRIFGFDEVHEQIGHTAVVGILRNGKGPMVGLCAAIDAQMIQEAPSKHDYCSENSGCMHALGHDGEVAMLLGAAKYLAAKRPFKGGVACIFYSAQGSGIGTRAMIEDGLFQQYPISCLYSLQSIPNLPVGSVELSAGPLMGAVAELFVKIIGRAGDPAFPHKANNPILAASAIVNSLETLAAYTLDPANPFSVSVTGFNSGQAFEQIPEEAELKASVRFLNPEIEEWLPGRIDMLVNKIAESYNTQSIVSYRLVCPPLFNEVHHVRFARNVAQKLLGNGNVHEMHPMTLIGNDLSYFLSETPGVCIPMGNGTQIDLLSPAYDFNDQVLPIGATLLALLVEQFQKK